MSSDDVEFFTIDKYDVSAFKRTIKNEFQTISTRRLDPKMSRKQIWDFRHLSSFHVRLLYRTEALKIRTIRFQGA